MQKRHSSLNSRNKFYSNRIIIIRIKEIEYKEAMKENQKPTKKS